MYRILLAVDGSEHSKKTVSEAARRAAIPGTEVTALFVVDYFSLWDSFAIARQLRAIDAQDSDIVQEKLEAAEKSMEKSAEELLKQVSDSFKSEGLEVNTVWKKGRPADVICSEANDEGYDLVILGNKGFSVLSMFLGSVANEVVQKVKASVLIVK